MKNQGRTLLQKDGTKTVLASLLSIVIGLAVGSILVLVVGLFSDNLGMASAWEGIRLIFFGILSTGRNTSGSLTWGFNPQSIGNMLFRATPLILTGLSVSVAFKTGLFNIGAPGQYLMGTMVTLAIALGIPVSALPSPVIWLLAFLGGMLAGALWGCIPGLFKAYLNVNEVITSIMTNWIAANLVTMLFDGSRFINNVDYGKTGYCLKTSSNGVATAKLGLDFGGSSANAGILIAVAFAVVTYVVINKTVFGYELRSCGSNKNAARYAGMNEKRNIVLSMAIAGGLSAAGAALYFLQGDVEFYWHTSMSLPATGFNGIPVALLASCSPIGCVFSGLFMAYLTISGSQLSTFTAYNEYIANIIIAVIVYLSAFTLFFKGLMSAKKKTITVKSEVAKNKAGEEMKRK